MKEYSFLTDDEGKNFVKTGNDYDSIKRKWIQLGMSLARWLALPAFGTHLLWYKMNYVY